MALPLKKDTLTKRQTEVAKYLAQGLSKPQIAEKLAIKPQTVASHCRSIKIKWRTNTEKLVVLQVEAKRRGYKPDMPAESRPLNTE